MTSQILSINRKEVIMSTEDVETIGNEKTYNGVKKLFNISNNPSICLMIHGPPIFGGIPMETLLNEFEKYDKRITSVLDTKLELLQFLGEVTPKQNLDSFIEYYLRIFKNDLKTHFKNISKKQFYEEINSYNKNIPKFLRKYFINESYFNDILPKYVINNKNEINLKLWKLFSEIITFGGVGIVIAGFDEKYHFSSFTNFKIIINNNGRIEIDEIETKLNINEPLIRVYATTTGADLFLNGIDHQIEEKLIEILIKNNELDEILLQQSINDLKMEFKESIENSIEWLPKKERLELNNTLIYLTALKQKISPSIETVGSNIHSCILRKDKEVEWIS